MSGFSNTIIIRQLEPDDSISTLTGLLHRAYAGLASQGLRYMATHQSEEGTRERISQGTCLVAILERQIVGTILFKDANQTSGCPWYDQPQVASLAQFAVEPGLQAQGLGRQFMTLAEENAVRSGAREIALDTAEPATHLVGWYTKLGYRFIEYTQWGHTNYRSVILSKAL